MADGPAFLDETVPDLLDGERVDRALSTLVPCSRSEATDAIAAGLVRLNDVIVTKASLHVGSGDR
ncbi:MAG TPA: S4 domain-containing protein, partial [Microthrixaceae bacterium]|nr:S4 domain-containing protein [Microthrixaceae bacterium]